MNDHDHRHHDHDHHDHDHGHHGHDHHGHDHHGHENDQGLKAMVRYLRMAPKMWHSEVNDAVVDLVAPVEGERVLDIGAGMGPAAVRAAGVGASVIAVEPTPYLRRILAARVGALGVARRLDGDVDVVDGAAEHLPVADHSIDAVWAVNTMHHWISAADGAAEIHRSLRPGGRVVLVDEDFGDPTHPHHEEWVDRHGGGSHGFTMVDAAEMGNLLEAAGLIEVDCGSRTLAGRPVLLVSARAAK